MNLSLSCVQFDLHRSKKRDAVDLLRFLEKTGRYLIFQFN